MSVVRGSAAGEHDLSPDFGEVDPPPGVNRLSVEVSLVATA